LVATKGFTHGRVSFDPIAKTVQFSRHPPLTLPDFAVTVKKDAILSFQLLAPDGTARPHKREVLILEGKSGQLFAPAVPKTPSKRSKEDGWRNRMMKFRAYFTHPGVETEPGSIPHPIELPKWLQDSIDRQRRFRNRLVKLCLDARNACCPVNCEEFTRIVKEAVLPAVDEFNHSLGRSRDKISVKKLRVETPSIFVLTRFGAYLQHLESDGKPVPAGLAQQISAFTKDLKIDFTPINEFQRNLDSIARRERYLESLSLVESEDEDGEVRPQIMYHRLTDPEMIEARRSELELRIWEWKPVVAGFKTSLKRRKTLGLRFSEGWPRFSDEKSPNWGIHYYLNGACSDASLLTRKGVRALHFEPNISPDMSGRKWKPTGRRARRELNPVKISFHDTLSGERFTFRFVVLRHQFPIPDGALVKEWKLIHNRTGLWLCFVVQGKFAKPATTSGATGAVHIGWRKEGPELWPAMVFNPACKGCDTFNRVVIDTVLAPEKSDEHTPFRINMGPSRKGRRSPYWISGSKPHLRAEPDAAGAVQIQDTWSGIEWLGRWRDDRKDIFKSLLLSSLNPVSAGLQKAGVRTLHKIGQSLTDPILAKAYNAWATEDKEIAGLMTEFSARVASRLSDGYSRVAHDVCQLFSEHGVSTIAIQDSLLRKIAKKKSRDTKAEQASLESSQANRHRIAPGQLLMKLSSVAETYGLNVVKVGNAHISRTHNSGDPECNHVNPQSAELLVTCEKCGKVYDQDENACRNMVANAVTGPPNGGTGEAE
jgi:hypothetical protein